MGKRFGRRIQAEYKKGPYGETKSLVIVSPRDSLCLKIYLPLVFYTRPGKFPLVNLRGLATARRKVPVIPFKCTCKTRALLSAVCYITQRSERKSESGQVDMQGKGNAATCIQSTVAR